MRGCVLKGKLLLEVPGILKEGGEQQAAREGCELEKGHEGREMPGRLGCASTAETQRGWGMQHLHPSPAQHLWGPPGTPVMVAVGSQAQGGSGWLCPGHHSEAGGPLLLRVPRASPAGLTSWHSSSRSVPIFPFFNW